MSDQRPSPFVSGFATVVGRPNVGKSTLVNAIAGTKVSIVSDKVQTTRRPVRAVVTRPGFQLVFVDTPGIHKPRTMLGERLNAVARASVSDVDVVVMVVDATAPLGKGDRFVAAGLPASSICAINKVDGTSRAQVLKQLAAAGELGLGDYFPVSARTGEGVDQLVAAIVGRLPAGPPLYPAGVVRDTPESTWVAELVREQLLAVLREELPHSVACRVTEWEWPRVRCEILVERESQKGIVIGAGGAVLKQVGINVRRQMPAGAYLELAVKVDKDWQRRPAALQRLGF